MTLGACARPALKPPARAGSESAALAIRVLSTPPIGFSGAQLAEQVFYVRRAERGPVQTGELIPANFERNGYVYLFNVAPGSYAPVSSVYDRVSLLPPLTSVFVTMFSARTVQRSAARVGTREVVFAGEYRLGLGAWDEADEVQRLIGRQLGAYVTREYGDRGVVVQFFYRGEAQELHTEGAALARFVAQFRKDFAGTAWAGLPVRSAAQTDQRMVDCCGPGAADDVSWPVAELAR